MNKTTESCRVKRLLVNVGVAAAAIVVSLLVVEIGFRLYARHLVQRRRATSPAKVIQIVTKAFRPSKDPDLVFEYGANLSFPGQPHFTNSAGMRGPERPVEKPPNTIRIAGLGDSVMAGDLYPAEKTFMFVLERLLNEASTASVRFESLNFAVAGYNTEEEAIVLRRKALAYKPDWVILGIVSNDRDRSAYYRVRDADGRYRLVSRQYIENAVPFSTGFKPGQRPWWAASALARWLHHRAFVKRDHRKSVERFCRAFAQIAQTCHAHRIRLLAVILTENVEVGQRENPRAAWHQLVRQRADEARVAVLDMYPAILKCLKESGIDSYSHYWTDSRDRHPNIEGHRLIARLIFEKLESLGILRQKPR